MISTIKTMAGLGVLLLTTSFHSPCHAMTQQTQATKPNTLTEQERRRAGSFCLTAKALTVGGGHISTPCRPGGGNCVTA